MYVQQPNDMTHYSNTDSDMVNQLIYVHQLKDVAFIGPESRSRSIRCFTRSRISHQNFLFVPGSSSVLPGRGPHLL
jgi:hypothetical protein